MRSRAPCYSARAVVNRYYHWRAFTYLLLLAAALQCNACLEKSAQSDSSAQPVSHDGGEVAAAPDSQAITVPEGTSIRIRLLQTITSRSARSGEMFDAELAEPISVNGVTVFERRARIQGRIMAAKSSGRLRHPGYLLLALDSIQLPDGAWLNVHTTSVSARGRSHKDRNLALIGGAAGLGTLIGGIAAGGKGAAIGAASGAGAGTAGAYATGQKDVSFPAEGMLTFRLKEPLAIQR
jgi:hypothetical protein